MKQVAIMHSGLRIPLDKPHPSLIRAEDIAEHLSKQCMYNGAPVDFYSVAQHCLIVATELSRESGLAALYGLLHHADEAAGILGELNRAKMQKAIHEAFDLDWPAPDTISKAFTLAHARVELAECRDVLTGREDRIEQLERLGVRRITAVVRPWDWDRAHRRFIDALRAYAIECCIPHLPAFGDIL